MIGKPNRADLLALRVLIDAGRITPHLERTDSLSDVPAALAHVETGRTRGKVAITI
jgi:NADPH:quinone reductase-like Zn-dependent oxidoreductase